MLLEEFYYVSQIVASVAVLASLIYLAVQTRQTSKNQQAQMHAARLQVINALVSKTGDPAFSQTWQTGLTGEPGLSEAQAREFGSVAYMLIQTFQEQHLELQEGMIDVRRWSGSKHALRQLLAQPGFRAMFKLLRNTLDKEFVVLVDALIVETKGQLPAPNIGPVWQMLAAEERAAMLAPK
jgi:hypothetical protein